MRYCYKCVNIQCKLRNKEVIIEMPMSEAGIPQKCEECGEGLQRIFGGAIKPAGDKAKY